MTKYVFHITHALSEAIAQLYIRKLDLRAQDCIILLARGSLVSNFWHSSTVYSVKSLFLDWCRVEHSSKSSIDSLQTHSSYEPLELTYSNLHKLFASFTHSPVLLSCTFYPPYLQSLLACFKIRLALMEDGIVSHSPHSYRRQSSALCNPCVGNQKLSTVLTVSPTAFFDSPNKLCLSTRYSDRLHQLNDSSIALRSSSTNVVCGESVRFIRTMKFDIYMEFLTEIFHKLSDSNAYKVVLFLPHPSYQYELTSAEKKRINIVLNRSNARICSPIIAPEIEAIESFSIRYTLHGLATSLLPYYTQLGGLSYCWTLRYINIWPTLRKAFVENRDSCSAGFFFANVIAPS